MTPDLLSEGTRISNERRTAAALLRKELAAGLITLDAALNDPRAGCIPVGRLLASQRYWGPKRAHGRCQGAGVLPTRRVRDLTDRQRAALTGADAPKTPLAGHIEFHVTDERALLDGLRALSVAVSQGTEPELVWAPGFRLALMFR